MIPGIAKNPQIETRRIRKCALAAPKTSHRAQDIAALSIGTMALVTMVRNASFVVNRHQWEWDSAAHSSQISPRPIQRSMLRSWPMFVRIKTDPLPRPNSLHDFGMKSDSNPIVSLNEFTYKK